MDLVDKITRIPGYEYNPVPDNNNKDRCADAFDRINPSASGYTIPF